MDIQSIINTPFLRLRVSKSILGSYQQVNKFDPNNNEAQQVQASL